MLRSLTPMVLYLSAYIFGCQSTTQRPTITLPELQQEITHQVRDEFRQKMKTMERLEAISDRLLASSLPLCKDRKAIYRFDYFDRHLFYNLDAITQALVLDYAGLEEIPAYPMVYKSQHPDLEESDQILEIGGRSVEATYRPAKSVTDGMGNVRKISGSWPDVVGKALKRAKRKYGIKQTPIVVKRRVEYWPSSNRVDRPAYKDSIFSTTIRLRAACVNEVFYVEDKEVNAYTDGKNIFVTEGMLNFATDEELAIVIAHELGHCYESHIDKKINNRMLGEMAAAILNTAAAQVLGIPTVITKSEGATVGAMVYSQEFELEADYIGLYLLARAGYSTETSARFWRKMAERAPLKSNNLIGTHPPTAERYLLLEKTHKEIEAKKARDEKLLPNRKGVALHE